MRDPADVVLLLHLAVPPVLDAAEAARLWAEAYAPLIDALHEAPGTRCALVLPGDLLLDLEERHPDGLDRIRALLARGQVELLATGLHQPLLPAIPERDAVGQLVAHATLLRRLLGARPRGCWLPHGAWDPALPRVLAKASLHYTLVEASRLAEVGAPADAVASAERDGAVVALLPMDSHARDLAATLPVPAFLAGLRTRSGRGVLALPAARFGLDPEGDPSRDRAWLASLLAALSGDAVRTVFPAEEVEAGRPWRRVALPAHLAPGLQSPIGRDLARYPEADRLHATMIRASRAVRVLDRAVREGAHSDHRPDPARLVQAQRYLYRAQAGAFYRHGPEAGIYDPALRRRAWRDLLRAEREVEQAMGTADRIRHEILDANGDGIPEVTLRTPGLRAVLDPARYGAVTELSVPGAARNLVDVMARWPEPYHLEGAPAEVDDGPRVLFRERFLGPDATLAEVREGTASEALDDAPWELVTAERIGEDAVRAILTRDGHLLDPSGERVRVRLLKRCTAWRDARLSTRLEVVNRGHEALRTRLAWQLDLALGQRGPALVARGRQLPLDRDGQLGEVPEVRLEGDGLAVRLELETPARIWHYPVCTSHRHLGRPAGAVQGICLLLLWPIELWAQEKARFKVTLTVEA